MYASLSACAACYNIPMTLRTSEEPSLFFTPLQSQNSRQNITATKVGSIQTISYMYIVFKDGKMYGLHQDEAAYDNLGLHCFLVQLFSFLVLFRSI